MTSLGPFLSLAEIAKTFSDTGGRRVEALTGASLEVDKGEFVSIVGPSGCGKTTLLRIVAGLEEPTSGMVSWGLDAARPEIGFVTQSASVFPWLTVEGNLTFAQAVRRVSKGDRERNASAMCQRVGLEPSRFLLRYPRELSGGETRRVALGVALSYGAPLLLCDEAISQLDELSRVHMQSVVQDVWMSDRPTVLYVTHDVSDALLMGDRVVLMRGGRVVRDWRIDLPRPRGLECQGFSSFNQYRREILDWLINESGATHAK